MSGENIRRFKTLLVNFFSVGLGLHLAFTQIWRLLNYSGLYLFMMNCQINNNHILTEELPVYASQIRNTFSSVNTCVVRRFLQNEIKAYYTVIVITGFCLKDRKVLINY